MQREEETAGNPRQEAELTPVENMEDLTDKIILAVLDYLDNNSRVRTDKTKGLLISTVEKLKQIATTTDVEQSGKKKKAQLLPDELRANAARAVSQVLLSCTEAWEMTSSSSSFPSELDLDSMLEAMARSGFPTDLMRSLLDATSQDIIKTIEGNKNVASYRNFILGRMTKRINEKVKTFPTESKELEEEREAEFEQDTEPCSSSHHPQMDNLTISCTHDVIDGIVQVCHQYGGGETKELSEQGVQEVMQELENMISSGRSSSKNDLQVIDLEESNETAPSHHESLLSHAFQQKIKHAVSDALLKTTGAVSALFSETLEDIIVEDLEMCAEQSGTSLKSSALVESAASEIAETVIEDLKEVSSHQAENGSVTEPAPSRNTFRSAACRLYRNVHRKVFGFLLRLQESESAVSIRPHPHLIPRIQFQEGSCTNEVCLKVVEFYKSEPLLSSSSYRRAFSSAAQTTTAADLHTAAVTSPVVEAVERNVESRNTAWATMNSSREMSSRISDVSSPEGPCRSDPFVVIRRVKDFLTHRFMGAGRPSGSHTPITTTDGEAHLTEELKEDHLLRKGSENTLPDGTRAYLTGDFKSPGLTSTASNRADANLKKRGLRFRKHLTRTFSAIRRALPNPFQCMTGPP